MPAAPSKRQLSSFGLLLLLVTSAALGAEESLLERYHALKNGTAQTLPGTSIQLVSTEEDGLLSAEVTTILPYPFSSVAPALASAESWCQFMPLHFNIKACTHTTEQQREIVTLYSGRKRYQSPADSHPLSYHVARKEQRPTDLRLVLRADKGPAGTRDYRIEVNALSVKEGTLVNIRTAYRPSMTSTLLTHTYLSTLGRDKVGFSRVEQAGEAQYVQGVRGVIERNVMRYHLAIDSFLSTRLLPQELRHQAALTRWFKLNEDYPYQLHEMAEEEYLAIKQREWKNQQQLQHALNGTRGRGT